MVLDAMILAFWMLNFKPAFSLSSFTFNKRPFKFYSLSAIWVVSSAYLRLLIFLLVILIPTCDSSILAFCMMYSAYKLNNQGDSIQPWHISFLIWNQSVIPCPVLTIASWPAYRFLRRQVRWSGIPISSEIFHSLLWSIHPTPVLLPGKSHGWRSLVGCRLWGSHRVGHDWSDLAAAAYSQRL